MPEFIGIASAFRELDDEMQFLRLRIEDEENARLRD